MSRPSRPSSSKPQRYRSDMEARDALSEHRRQMMIRDARQRMMMEAFMSRALMREEQRRTENLERVLQYARRQPPRGAAVQRVPTSSSNGPSARVAKHHSPSRRPSVARASPTRISQSPKPPSRRAPARPKKLKSAFGAVPSNRAPSKNKTPPAIGSHRR